MGIFKRAASMALALMGMGNRASAVAEQNVRSIPRFHEDGLPVNRGKGGRKSTAKPSGAARLKRESKRRRKAKNSCSNGK